MVNVVAGNSEQSGFVRGSESPEERAIARLERVRRDVLRTEAELQRVREDSERFGESQGDQRALADRLRNGRRELAAAQAELDSVRARGGENSAGDAPAPSLSNYLERRRFSRDFPEDARLLKTFQYYTSGGVLSSFSVAAGNLLGSIVDVQI